jgi:hypothetical protein
MFSRSIIQKYPERIKKASCNEKKHFTKKHFNLREFYGEKTVLKLLKDSNLLLLLYKYCILLMWVRVI